MNLKDTRLLEIPNTLRMSIWDYKTQINTLYFDI